MLTLCNGWRPVPLPRRQLPPGLPDFSPGTRAYQRDVADGHLSVFVARDAGLWHLSISHRLSVPDEAGYFPPGRLPTWEEIKEARYALVPDGVTMALLLPPAAEFINVHPTTMHLWQVPADVAR
jgi:hypothetical protein